MDYLVDLLLQCIENLFYSFQDFWRDFEGILIRIGGKYENIIKDFDPYGYSVIDKLPVPSCIRKLLGFWYRTVVWIKCFIWYFFLSHPTQNQEINTELYDSLEEQYVTDCSEFSSMAVIHFVFSIHEIQTKILNSLEKNHLLKCRCLSRRWNSLVTPMLLKITHVNLETYVLTTKGCAETLWKLTKLLQAKQDKQRQNSDSILFSFPFPCVKFTIRANSPSYKSEPYGSYFILKEVLRRFIFTHGAHIEELCIQLPGELASKRHEKTSVNGIRKLLLRSPNLSKLTIEGGFNIKFNSSSTLFSLLAKSSKDLQNTKLKLLFLKIGLTDKILSNFIEMAPNLEEIHTIPYNYRYFLQPPSRLRFIKSVWVDAVCNFNPSGRNEENILLQVAKESGKGSLNLREIRLSFFYYSAFLEDETKILSIMNLLVEGNWRTLESIFWEGVPCLKRITWPKVMPRLMHLHLCSIVDSGQYIFPNGFSWLSTFPCLETLFFCNQYGNERFGNFLCRLNFDGNMRNIKKVRVRWISRGTNYEDNLKEAKKAFPLAKCFS